MGEKKPVKYDELNLKLVKEVKELGKIVNNLHKTKPFDIMNRPKKLMWMSFLKGLMVGFGSALGATVVVAGFLYLLAKVEYVPFIGDFVQEIRQEIEPVQNR